MAEGLTVEQVAIQTRAIPETYYEPYKELPFRFIVDDYMKKIALDEQISLINRFSFMPLKGPVSMKEAKVTFSIHCDDIAKRVYFGRLV